MRSRVAVSFSCAVFVSVAVNLFQPATHAAARARFDYYLTGNAADISPARGRG
jgi:hypothetical protein